MVFHDLLFGPKPICRGHKRSNKIKLLVHLASGYSMSDYSLSFLRPTKRKSKVAHSNEVYHFRRFLSVVPNVYFHFYIK